MPVAPGESATLWYDSGQPTPEPVAAVFIDGTVVGTALTADGFDMIRGIKDFREAEQREQARWIELLRADLRIETLRAELARVPSARPTNSVESGTRGVSSDVDSLVNNNRNMSDKDLVELVVRNLQDARNEAIRNGKVN
jgi:hypothetical protein